MGQTLNFLGRASYFNTKEANNSAYYRDENNLLLIDCGRGVFDEIIKLNLLHNVKTVYIAITHIHKDHVADLPAFLNVCNQKNLMPHIIKSESVSPTILFAQPQYKTLPYGEFVAQNLGLIENKDYVFVEQSDKTLNQFVKVKSHIVEHMSYENNMICCAFSCLLNNKKVFYSGDCNKIEFNLKNYDEYYFECSLHDPLNVHLSLTEIESIIEENNIQKNQVYLMHIENQKTINIFSKKGFQVASLALETQKEL